VLLIVLPFRLLADGALFARLLARELHNAAADDQHDEDDDHRHQHDQQKDHADGDGDDNGDDREFAMRLLGLQEGFSDKALSKAYRQAIAAAHPDSPGGSEEAAKQINAARDLLSRPRRRM
jgi:ABC-type Zn2+ transport system substrate-binding protein/surface adhesin